MEQQNKMIRIDELIGLKDVSAHSHISKILYRYNDKEVITSYIKNDFGVAFLIKGKVKAFAFAIIKRNLCANSWGFNASQLTPNDYFKLRANIEDKKTIHILDEETEDKIKAKLLLNELEMGN